MTQPASNRWTVIYYRDKQGRHPVEDFLRSLTSNARAALMRDFSLLEEFGLNDYQRIDPQRLPERAIEKPRLPRGVGCV